MYEHDKSYTYLDYLHVPWLSSKSVYTPGISKSELSAPVLKMYVPYIRFSP